MQNQLNVQLIQTDIFWENTPKNLNYLEAKINSIQTNTDLIVLPEMFSTGFTMQPMSVAENMEGTAVVWMQKMAKSKNTAIAGSLVISENNKYYNRFLFVESSGKITIYDKRHLFSYAGEDKIYTPGKEKTTIHYKGWKIAPFICYDLRFPVWSRNTENYDIALYVANWPKSRTYAWDSLLKARAIENMCYCIAVNRTGKDKNNLEYIGHSQIINPLGETIQISTTEKEEIISSTLYKDSLISIRDQFQFLNDRDTFNIKL